MRSRDILALSTRTNPRETLAPTEREDPFVTLGNWARNPNAWSTRNLNPSAFSYDSRLAKVEQFVLLHYRDPLPLETAARVAGLEKTYFSKYFHEKTGMCYLTWLSWIRVQSAIALMRAAELPITDVAFSVGFQDVRTFERAFARHVGMSANALRRYLRRGVAVMVAILLGIAVDEGSVEVCQLDRVDLSDVRESEAMIEHALRDTLRTWPA
jgi:AraC-like DNA-binding protein